MKKYSLFAILILAAACSQQQGKEVVPEYVEQELTFNAIAPGNEMPVKTTRDPEGKVYWSPSEEISIFYVSGSNGGGKFTSNNTSSASTAQFSGTIRINTDFVGNASEAYYWGVYPYNSANTCDGSSVTMIIPDEQASAEGSFSDGMFPSVGRSIGQDMSFFSVCGGFKFRIGREGITKVAIKGNNNEVLAGKVKVSFDGNGRPSVSEVIEGKKEILVTPAGGGSFKTDTDYYIVIRPVTFSSGVTFNFEKADGAIGSRTVDASFPINRTEFQHSSTAIDSGVTIIRDEIINFADNNTKSICVAHWDKNGDGELSTLEAAAVTSLEETLYQWQSCTSFDELQYFINLTKIPDVLFLDCCDLSSVIIPENVSRIGEAAFSSCYSLTSVIIPDSVTSIGSLAFAGCGFTSINVPGTVTSIGLDAFSGCSALVSFISPLASQDKRCLILNGELVGFCPYGLNSYTVPSGVTRIGEVFNGSNLTTITLPSGVVSIADNAFRFCYRLSSINIPDSVTSIGKFAFDSCQSLTSISIPNGVTTIEDGLFGGCTVLNAITIPSSVTSIGTSAFAGCGFTSINIPGSVTSIGASAFFDSGLTSILIPDSVTSIGEYAFADCTALTSITVNAITPPECSYSFSGTNNCPIYVPEESVETYKAAEGWDVYANRIFPIDNSIHVTRVSLDSELVLTVGQTMQLTAVISPSNATNKNVTWSSNNTDVATVDANGMLTAVSVGSATVSVATEDGGMTASCVVTVNPVAVTGVTIDPASLNFSSLNTSQKLTAIIIPENATNQNVTWKSDKTNIATVASDGTVTSKGSGTAKITVSTVDGNKTAICTVTVKVPVTGVSLDQDRLDFTSLGASQKLNVTVLPTTATNKNVTWSSSNTAVATVSSGTVTSKGYGEAVITVKTVDGSKEATCSVSVRRPVTGVSLDKTTLKFISLNTSQQLTANISPNTATNKNVYWTSSDTSIATVSSNGNVTSRGYGSATITVETVDGGKTAKCNVIVNRPVSSISLSPTTLSIGEYQMMEATVTPDNASDKSLRWTSSDPSIANVGLSDGRVYGLSPGTTTITATSQDGSEVSGSCNVTVVGSGKSFPSGTTFDEDAYITYVSNEYHYFQGDNYYAFATVFPCNVSGVKLEMKVQSDVYNSKFLGFGFRYSSYGFYKSRRDESEFECLRFYSQEAVKETDILTLTANTMNSVLTIDINGIQSSLSGVDSMGSNYIFSSYDKDYDEGWTITYDAGVPNGTRLYYVKVWDESNNLVYFGHACRAVNPINSQEEYCWYYKKAGEDAKYIFALHPESVSGASYSNPSRQPFGGGID